jgi:hypothetical protein
MLLRDAGIVAWLALAARSAFCACIRHIEQ